MSHLIGKSTDPETAGVYGDSSTYNGVRGVSYAPGHGGVVGISEVHNSDPTNHPENNPGPGVYGASDAAGVWGESKNWLGVYGHSNTGHGVWGESENGAGLVGIAHKWHGLHAKTESTTGGHGVLGEHLNTGIGVMGKSENGIGVTGISKNHEAIRAETNSREHPAIRAINLNNDGGAAAIYATKGGENGHAGYFDGNVEVTKKLLVNGDIFLKNGDCAEEFDIVDNDLAEPGTVMVFSEEGELSQCRKAYDTRVAGVISGAGDYKPGIVLDKQQSDKTRKPIALLGKVYCKVDASYASIHVGDLLTTSSSAGHAMKADDPRKAFGAVIGKALRPWKEGKGLIPILVCLQ